MSHSKINGPTWQQHNDCIDLIFTLASNHSLNGERTMHEITGGAQLPTLRENDLLRALEILHQEGIVERISGGVDHFPPGRKTADRWRLCSRHKSHRLTFFGNLFTAPRDTQALEQAATQASILETSAAPQS